jgi:hypothetical protein
LACQQNRLVGTQCRGRIDLAGGNPGKAQIVFCADDEADLLLVQGKQLSEIQIAPVDYQDRTRRQIDRAEQAHVVNFARGDANEYGNRATQVDPPMGFDGSFGLPEMRPVKQPQAQINRGRVYREDGSLQSQSEILVSIQRQGKDEMAPG